MIKTILPVTFKDWLKIFIRRQRIRGKGRIFCISFQKTGTTSVGDFFESFGFLTARRHHSDQGKWTQKWFDGNFDAIFNSSLFNSFQVFEDTPWWFPEFYKILYHRFPDSRFIFFKRNPDDWFQSMANSFHGKDIETLRIHAKLYRRENEFYDKLKKYGDRNNQPADFSELLSLQDMDNHYKEIYTMRNREVTEYFEKNNPDRIFECDLADPDKWKKLADFVGITIPEGFQIHANKTTAK